MHLRLPFGLPSCLCSLLLPPVGKKLAKSAVSGYYIIFFVHCKAIFLCIDKALMALSRTTGK